MKIRDWKIFHWFIGLEHDTQSNIAVAVATIIITFATIANLFVSGMMWWTMRNQLMEDKREFDVSHRPFLGLSESHISQPISRIERNKITNALIDSTVVGFEFTETLKNFGDEPATILSLDLRMRLGSGESDAKPQTVPSIIFPENRVELRVLLSDSVLAPVGMKCQWIADNIVPLKLTLRVKYRGTAAEIRETYQEQLFVPAFNGWSSDSSYWK